MDVWHPFTEIPPRGRFIALVKATDYKNPKNPTICRTAEFCYYVDGIGYVLEESERFSKVTILIEVTHWMKVPDFPKEAENETR